MHFETTSINKPILLFEFADASDKIKPMIFKDPVDIITASTIDQVIPSLKRIEEAVKQGNYAAGYLSYESAPAFDAAFQVREGSKMPLLWFGIYSSVDYQYNQDSICHTLHEWKPSVAVENYKKAISKIREHIRNGDTYQVNYTIRLHSEFNDNSIALFNRLKKAQSSDYCAYLNIGTHSIVSASCELFFRYQNGMITTKPMKGTMKRGRYYEEDVIAAKRLYESEKDKAENVMIVDLLRNDLGMIADMGTVKVTKLFDIEKYPTVHQMTSTVTASVSKDIGISDILKALFPCGSITGAPKVSTMRIIADTESEPREVYCGAIGYITPEQEAVFNVPIRTAFIDNSTGKAVYGVGGGITWDSTSEGEYEEVLAKSSLLNKEVSEFNIFESLLLEEGEYYLLDRHLNRMRKAALYFDYPFQEEAIQSLLKQYAGQRKNTREKVRIQLSKQGELNIDGVEAVPYTTSFPVILADSPVDKNNPFLFHKTTNRSFYDRYTSRKSKDIFDVLLWNTEGELTEFTSGNVVLELNGQFYTPKINCGLLGGTFREHLIEQKVILEKVLTLEDLKSCTRLWFINSVRRWVEIYLIET